MQKISIKCNGQCSINIPKEILKVLGWKAKEIILVSKMLGQDHIVIENITKNKRK